MNALVDIAADIRDHHAQAQIAAESAVEHAMEVGRLLIQAKEQLAHGTFMPWLADNCQLADRTARAYMALYRRKDEITKTATVADLTIRQAITAITASKPTPVLSPTDWTEIALNDGRWIDITPSQHPGFVHIGIGAPTGDGGCNLVTTKRPIRHDMAPHMLDHEVGLNWRNGDIVRSPCQGLPGNPWADGWKGQLQ